MDLNLTRNWPVPASDLSPSTVSLRWVNHHVAVRIGFRVAAAEPGPRLPGGSTAAAGESGGITSKRLGLKLSALSVGPGAISPSRGGALGPIPQLKPRGIRVACSQLLSGPSAITTDAALS